MNRSLPIFAAVLCVGFVGEIAPARSADPHAAFSSSKRMEEIITAIVRESIPHQYEDTRKWGGQKEVWAGLKIERDGLRIKTKRRKKLVNDGTWKRYWARLKNPNQSFRIRAENVRSLPSGRVGLTLVIDAEITAFGRVSEWVRDVQLYSFSVDADAVVQLRIDCDLGTKLDIKKLPPDVLLDPVVTDARLRLIRFELLRISELKGPLVRELGDGMRKVIEEKVAEKRHKIVQKINRQIDKKRDSLRLSLSEVTSSPWGKAAEKFLPKK